MAVNDDVVIVQMYDRSYVWKLDSGVRVAEFYIGCLTGNYCPKKNIFYKMDLCSYSWLYTFTVKNFKPRNLAAKKKKKKLPEQAILLDEPKGMIKEEIKEYLEASAKETKQSQVINSLIQDQSYALQQQYKNDEEVPKLAESKIADLNEVTKSIILSYVKTHIFKDNKIATNKIVSKTIPVGEAMFPFMTTKNGTSISISQLAFAVNRLETSISTFNEGELTAHKQMELSTLILFLHSFLQNLACCRVVLKEFTRETPDLQQQIIDLTRKLSSIVPVEGSETKELEALTSLETMQLRLVDYAQDLAELIPTYLGKEALELLDDLSEIIGTANTDEGSKQVIELITGLTREEPLNKILSSKKE
jgi:hypothetical protein